MEKTTSILLVVLLLAGMLSALVVPASATEAHELPTTYNGKTIDWTASGKKDTVVGDGKYYADNNASFAALFNVYYQAPVSGSDYADASFDSPASAVAVWIGPEGLFTTLNIPYDVEAAAWPKVLAGETMIAGLTDAQKAAAADEIAYFSFVAGKVKEFTMALNSSDTWHQGLDVIGFIVADAVQAIEEIAKTVADTPTLPGTYQGKTIDWTISGKKDTVMGDGKYYADNNASFAALFNVYYEAPASDSLYAHPSFGDAASAVAVWIGPEGLFTTLNIPYDVEAAAWPKVLAGETLIAGMTDAQKALAADEIEYFTFVASKVKEFTMALNSDDIWHQGLDVIGFIVADAVEAIETAIKPAPVPTDLPTTYKGKTIDWTVSGKRNAVTGDGKYYPDTNSAFSALFNVYYKAPATGSDFAISSFDAASRDADSWIITGGLFVTSNIPYDTNAAAWPKILAGEAMIKGLSADQKAAAADEIAYFTLVANKVKEFTNDLNANDLWHEGLDVIGYIVADAVRAVEAKTSVVPPHQHSIVAVNETPASCTAPGTKAHFKCEGCKKLFTTADATTEITDKNSLVFAVLGHDMVPADCVNASICRRCDHTTGEALGHDMAPANCVNASTCRRDGCGHTEGEALGHDMAPADCENASTCRRDGCGHTEGEALGHDMTAADCENASTCRRDGCGHTEGEALGHDFEEAWSHDDTHHWHDCSRCDATSDKGEHSNANGACACGFTAGTTSEETTEGTSSKGCRSLTSISALLTVLSLSALCVSVGRKKEN